MHKFASVLAGFGLLILAACGGSSNDNPALGGAAQSAASTTTTAVAAATTVTTARAAATTTPTTAAAVQKVNANTASQAEIQAALTAANVPSAAQWAREVTEYRPYPTNDPTFAKLRQNLAKYNPGPGVVDQIISVLSL